MSARSDDDTGRIIRNALEREEAEGLGTAEDPSMTELLTEMFRGRHRRLAIGGAVVNLLLLGAGVFSAVRFFGAEEPRGMLLWGGGTLLSFGAVTAIKVWYWLEMVRLSLTREVKRLELQVSRLAEKIDGR